MIDAKNSNTKSTTTALDFEHSQLSTHLNAQLNLNIYKELDENPNQNLDLLTHVKNQLHQLELIHKRKMFLIKELAAVHSR